MGPSPLQILMLLVGLATLLATARLLGAVTRRLGQPAVLGELVAGLVLGPTLLGAIAPAATAAMFPRQAGASGLFTGFAQVAGVIFLLVAGMELQLPATRRQRLGALGVSVSGIAVPFALGFAAARWMPGWIARPEGVAPLAFELVFATALAISALPVIARTLLDLGLYRTDVGIVTMVSAAFDDLAGWSILAVILGVANRARPGALPIAVTLGGTVAFALFMVLVARPLVDRALGWVRERLRWQPAILGAVVLLALASAACTEWLGVHALFGALLAGVAVGDSRQLEPRPRRLLERAAVDVFAPIFFATLGLRVDLVRHFDATLVAIVLAVGSIGKIVGCGLAARAGGLPWRPAWAIGLAMNARGAMGIVIGVVALDAGLVDQRLFVAIVALALVTSLMSGPSIRAALGRDAAADPVRRRVPEPGA